MEQPNNREGDRLNQIPEIVLIVNDGDWDCHYDAGMLVEQTNILTGETHIFYECASNSETPESEGVNEERSRVNTYDAFNRLICESDLREQNDLVEHWEFE